MTPAREVVAVTEESGSMFRVKSAICSPMASIEARSAAFARNDKFASSLSSSCSSVTNSLPPPSVQSILHNVWICATPMYDGVGWWMLYLLQCEWSPAHLPRRVACRTPVGRTPSTLRGRPITTVEREQDEAVGARDEGEEPPKIGQPAPQCVGVVGLPTFEKMRL